jgi:hypothetical protein
MRKKCTVFDSTSILSHGGLSWLKARRWTPIFTLSTNVIAGKGGGGGDSARKRGKNEQPKEITDTL